MSLHRIIRHMWETPDARVAMFSKTMKNSKEGGPWSKLHRNILPEWIKAGIGIQYTTRTSEGRPGPKVTGDTRTPFFKIRNCHGGESECFLFSLDYVEDVEDKLKEMEFSMIYFSELDKFNSRKVLSVALPSLRMSHLRYDQQMWLADTNPSEEGEGSWIYEVWYVEKNLSYDEYKIRQAEMGRETMPERLFLQFQAGLRLVEIKPEENPWLDPRQLDELKTTYAYDPGLYARYVEGKWIYGDGDRSRHFRGFFKPNLHIIGNCESSNPDDWEYANPGRNCFELITGWDLGDTNHAACILEKTIINGKSHFTMLDELVSLGEDISNEEFTLAFMELIDNLEFNAGKQFDLDRSWSDSSSIEKYSATGDTYPYLQVESASKGRIYLKRGPKKVPGSVQMRVKLLKQLLHQGRIKISAHCKFAIKMFKELKKGLSSLQYIPQGDENKHIFDALTYALLMECYEELEMNGPDFSAGKRQQLVAVHI